MAIKIDRFVPVRSSVEIDRPQNQVPKTIASAPKDGWSAPSDVSRLFSEHKLAMSEFTINIGAANKSPQQWWTSALMELLPPLPKPLSQATATNSVLTNLLRDLVADQRYLQVDLIDVMG